MDLDLILSSLGWALLHSIWQGFAAAGIVYAFRRIYNASDSSLRYSFQFLCLGFCFIAFLTTFSLNMMSGLSSGPSQAMPSSFTEIIAFGKSAITPTAEASGRMEYGAILNQSAPLLGAFWLLGFVIISMRCAVSYQMTQSLRKKGLSPAPEAWAVRFKTLARQAGLTRMAEIYISNRVTGPITLGFFKPVVLVPASFFTQLPKDQIEAVLLHELAHIRRHDYLLNILQTAIKAVLFYHPGVHYICRKINDDREYACDDFSVNATQDPKSLAKALAALRLSHPENSFAMAAKGSHGPLLARLQRLVPSSTARNSRERGSVAVPAIALLMSTAVYFAVAPVSQAHPDPNPEPAYQHAKSKLKNYKFKTIKHKGKSVTVKVTEDGRRWVLMDGVWYDADKRADILDAMPAVPTPPTPPAPPVIAGIENAGSKASEKAMRKFEKQMDQFEIDSQYYEKSMQNWSREYGHNFNQTFGNEFAENFGEEFSEQFGEEFGQEWSDEFRQEFEENFAREFAENYSKSFEEEGWDMEAGEHPERDKRAEDRAAEMRERMLERAERQREKSLAKAEARRERSMERAEEQRERMEEARDRAEEARERAEEQRERALERAEEQRERAEERRERAMEKAEASRERAEAARERAEQTRMKHTELRYDLTKSLVKNGYIASASDEAVIVWKNDRWVVNGKQMSKADSDKYCEILNDAGVPKGKQTKITLKPDMLQIQSKSEKGDNNTKITFGRWDHDEKDHEHHDNDHDDKKDSWKEGTNSSGFIQPISTSRVTARFGQENPVIWKPSHQGIDLAAPVDTPIGASAAGTVVKVESHPTYGNLVEIEHQDGYKTRYTHMKKTCAKEGQSVSAGEQVGSVGMSGNTTGPHLHFEVRKDGKVLDPEDLIAGF